MAHALDDLDHEGWNPSSAVGRASWLRVSVISTRFKEEILEISLGSITDDLEERARCCSKYEWELATNLNFRSLQRRLREFKEPLPLTVRDRSYQWVLEITVAENFSQLSKEVDFVYNDVLSREDFVIGHAHTDWTPPSPRMVL